MDATISLESCDILPDMLSQEVDLSMLTFEPATTWLHLTRVPASPGQVLEYTVEDEKMVVFADVSRAIQRRRRQVSSLRPVPGTSWEYPIEIDVDDGPYYQVIKHAPNPYTPRHLGFLDLAPEIRNSVYSYIDFTEESPVRIRSVFLGIPGLRSSYMRPQAYRGSPYAYGPESKRRCAGSGLALCCKQVAEETLPLLYDNAFEFSKLVDLDTFLTKIGPSIKLLRHLTITDYKPWILGQGQKVFAKLAAGAELQSLTINFCHIFGRWSSARSVAEDVEKCLFDFKPLLLSVGEARAPHLIKATGITPCLNCQNRGGQCVEEMKQMAAMQELLEVRIAKMAEGCSDTEEMVDQMV